MQDIYVKSLMTTTVATTPPEAELVAVIQAMLDHHYSCMVVLEEEVPVGIVTERDFIRLLAERDDSAVRNRKVTDVMTRPVITVTEETSLFDALVTITSHNIRHLPVVSSAGNLVGLVSLANLAKSQFHVFERQREIIEYSITVRTRQLIEANEKLKVLSMVDGLLDIGNRRAMEVDLECSHAQSVRYHRDYSVALFDIDFFKRYNDFYGHLAGDIALRKVAKHLQGSIRKADRLYRYGGEEILLLLPETSLAGAEILVGRILERLESLAVPHQMSPHNVLTMSCGIACQTSDGSKGKNWREVVALADKGLYQAKQEGRNRYVALELQGITETIRSCVYNFDGRPVFAG